jgi:4-oxalocrotonate tautomerase
LRSTGFHLQERRRVVTMQTFLNRRRWSIFMPIVRVLMYPGRTQQQKDDLAKAITDAVEKIAKAPRDQTIVVIQEVPKEQYYVAANRAT